MSLVIISKKSNQQEWIRELHALEPDLDIEVYADDSAREEVDFALAWHPPLGAFNDYPNLKWITSTGAGVDHILRDPELPEDIIITRVVDGTLTDDMTSYLVAQVMCQMRNVAHYKLLQTNNEWQPKRYRDKANTSIADQELLNQFKKV